jgi:hypothetical protein
VKRCLLSFVALLSGCEDPLKEAQVLEEARAIGVRVATSDGQASLVSGQSAELEVLLAGPEGPVQARLAYVLCQAAPADHGVPSCAAEAFAAASVDLDGTPVAFDVPASLADGARLALLGTACLQGEPELGADPLDWTCSDGESPLRLSFDAWAANADFSNANPDLAELAVSIGGNLVPLDDPHAPAGCEAGVPEVSANATYGVQITLGAGAREAGESLQLSHFSSRGLFERQFSFVGSDGEAATALTWRAPEPGAAAKSYLVVRDGRGGVSWVSFSVCAR